MSSPRVTSSSNPVLKRKAPWKSSRYFGFRQNSNFVLFSITCGILMAFVLGHFRYLDIDGTFLVNGQPSDMANFQRGWPKVGITMHLYSVLPAGFLACFQFVPAIRNRALAFHRINGNIVNLLFVLSFVGAIGLGPYTAGGNLDTQSSVLFLGASTMYCCIQGYKTIKELRLDLHRVWMIRTWSYAASIVTMRVLLVTSFVTAWNTPQYNWYAVQTCRSIFEQYRVRKVPDDQNPTSRLYPACADSNSTELIAINGNGPGPENASSIIHLSFGTCMWVALAGHILLAEIYLHKTQDETERLRKASTFKRIKAGLEADPSKTTDGPGEDRERLSSSKARKDE